jgi:hypothetical protein
MAKDGERLALLDEIENLERALENHPSWKAWRALDSRIGLGRGPEPKMVGALVGGYAMDLVEEPSYIALLAARDQLRRLTANPVRETNEGNVDLDETKSRAPSAAGEPPSLIPLQPAPPFAPPPAPDKVIDAEFSVATEPDVSGHRSSLMDRLATLEQEATNLVQTVSPTIRGSDQPPIRRPALDEADVEIVPEDEAPAKLPGGLVTRLETMDLARKVNADRHRPMAVEEADVEIIVEEDANDRS